MTDTDTVSGLYRIVEAALKQYGRIAFQHRYGGMQGDYELAKKAFEAWERIKQPPLFDVFDAALRLLVARFLIKHLEQQMRLL